MYLLLSKIVLDIGTSLDNEGMIAVNNDTWMLILLLAVVFGALVATTTFSGRGSLDSIKSKTVGDGQHGTARWATPGKSRRPSAPSPS